MLKIEFMLKIEYKRITWQKGLSSGFLNNYFFLPYSELVILFSTIQFTQVFKGIAIAEDKAGVSDSCVGDGEIESQRLAENDNNSQG